MGNIITEYPDGFMLLCPLLGAVFALLLYFRDQKLNDLSKAAIWGLAFLRFSVVTIIAFLLLGPLIRNFTTRIEQPLLVVAVDNSQSLGLTGDSLELKEQLKNMEEKFSESLSEDFELAFYTFGSELKRDGEIDFSEPVTDFSTLLSGITSRYSNRNLAGIVLAGDGIYNRGSNPRYAALNLGVPIHTVALGDTTVRRDAKIAEVASNRLAFLGNTFPVEARILTDEMEGEELRIEVLSQGKIIDEQRLSVDRQSFEKSVRFLIEADKPGLKNISVRIRPLSDEVTLANNQSEVFIEVVDSRKKILLLAQAPHPDVYAIRSAITGNKNYELEVFLEKEFTGKAADYDLIILHQLPSITTAPAFLQEINDSDIPVLSVLGEGTTLSRLKSMGMNLGLTRGRNGFVDAKGYLNPNFSLFKIKEDIRTLLQQAPPLRVAFGDWLTGNASETLLYQKVGPVETSDPLIVFNSYNEKKSAAILGEGIWRWRITDYALNESHILFDEFLTSMVQYLAVKDDKRLFRVQAPSSIMENERLIISADLYNSALEPVNDADVQIELTNDEGNTFPFNFTRTNSAYRLDAGSLPVGIYTYVARCERNGEIYTDQGALTIKPFALEAANLRANHRLLMALSQASGGEMVVLDQSENLIDKIKSAPSAQPVSYTSEVLDSVLNLKWPFFIILFLLSLEWFIRKRSGHY